MNNLFLIPLAACVVFAATGCDRQSPDVAKKISELERKNSEAVHRQLDLEQQLAEQKLAAERDAIERERAKIEEDRVALELQQGEAAAAQDEAIRKRDAELAERAGKLDMERTALAEKQDELLARGQELSERDRELAGREALPFEPAEQSVPVGDYGMFYDSLSSYGSWLETPDYGYVWQPAVVRDSGWRPYSRGRWICSDRGWNWVSEEPFGWATYHYGRWALLRGRGWIWVPGTQWAPCWVSWRQSDNHIGWAPLPPETLAYRNHSWDSSVDTQFNIGPQWFNFVGIRDFGGPIGDRCLPVSGNVTIIDRTNNITNIHIENRQVISGGPRYRDVSDRIGRPLPFYRLEVDADSRPGRDPMAMRPRIQGNRLTVAAPNLDAGWNERLKPARLKERIDNVTVERGADLSAEITGRYRQSREEGRHLAEQAIAELGGNEKFDQRRTELLQTNRRQAGSRGHEERPREMAVVPELLRPDASVRREVAPVPAGRTDDRKSAEPRRELSLRPAQAAEVRKEAPAGNRPQQPQKAGPEPAPTATPSREIAREAAGRRQQEQAQPQQRDRQPREFQLEPVDRRQQEKAQQQQAARQREAQQAGDAQKEALARRQQEQAQQQQREQQRQAQQAGDARKEALARRQQEQAQQQRREQQGQAQQAGDVQKEALARRQQEQAQQQRREQQGQAQQERESQLESLERTRQEQAQQQQREQQRQAQQARESQLESLARTRQEQAQQQQREQQRQAAQARAAQQQQPQQEIGRQGREQVQRQAQEQEQFRQRTEQQRQQQERVPRKQEQLRPPGQAR